MGLLQFNRAFYRQSVLGDNTVRYGGKKGTQLEFE